MADFQNVIQFYIDMLKQTIELMQMHNILIVALYFILIILVFSGFSVLWRHK